MKILKNKLGFTLVELMIALAATGIVSLGVAELTSEQIKDKTYLESKNEEGNLVLRMRSALGNFNGCSQTLSTTNGRIGGAINNILNNGGNNIISVGSVYGANRNISVSAINVVPVVVPPAGGGDGLVSLNITTTRQDTDTARTTFIQSILVKIATGPTNLIENCSSSSSVDIEDEVAENFCLSTGGELNASLVCVYPTCSIDSSTDDHLVTGNCLTQITTELTDRYVNLSGDTITGPLNINGNLLSNSGNIISGNTICVEGAESATRCMNFQASEDCSTTNGYARGDQGTGNPSNCTNFTKCSPVQYFAGINQDGSPDCRPIPFPLNKSCGSTAQHVVQIHGDGTVTCGLAPAISANASSGYYINDLSPRSVNYDPDRKMQGSCSSGQGVYRVINGQIQCGNIADRNVFGRLCPSGQAVQRYTSAGNPVCVVPGSGSSCTPSWGPSTATVCSGVSFTQTDGCGNSRTRTGIRTGGSCSCTPNWTPDPSTECSGVSFTQTDGCSNSRTRTGTMTGGACGARVCGYVGRLGTACPAHRICLAGDPNDSCGNPCLCSPTSPTAYCPPASNVCNGRTYTGSDGAGGFCSVSGTQTSGTDIDGVTCSGGGGSSDCLGGYSYAIGGGLPNSQCCPTLGTSGGFQIYYKVSCIGDGGRCYYSPGAGNVSQSSDRYTLQACF